MIQETGEKGTEMNEPGKAGPSIQEYVTNLFTAIGNRVLFPLTTLSGAV